MRNRAGLTALILITALGASLPAAALELGGHDRDGTVFGLNVGGGWTKIKFEVPDGEGGTVGDETNTTGIFTGGARIGWAPNDNFVYSIGLYGWKRSLYQDITPISVSNFIYMLELAWYPAGEGFWIRGGVGGGTLDFSITLPAALTTFQETGWNYSGGAGWELRVADSAALGIAYDYRYLTVGAFEGLEDTRVGTHSLTLNIAWYMD